MFDEPSTKNTASGSSTPRPTSAPPSRRRCRRRRRLLRRRRHAAPRPPRSTSVSAGDQVQRHAPPGPRRLRLRARRRRHRVAVAYGWESDYKSLVLSGTTHHDLYEHNFTLALAYSHNLDSVCDADNTAAAGLPLDLRRRWRRRPAASRTRPAYVTHPLSIDTFEPSLSWTMTPRLVVQGGATIQILDGFQSNPYRKVLVGSQNRTPQEHLPEFRQRYARVRAAGLRVPRAARVDARDGARLRRQLGRPRRHRRPGRDQVHRPVDAAVAARATTTCRAAPASTATPPSYRTLGPAGQYWTGDRELSPMGNYLLGGKLAFFRRPQQERASWFVEMELGAKYELLDLPARIARSRPTPTARSRTSSRARSRCGSEPRVAALRIARREPARRLQAAARGRCDRMPAFGIQAPATQP